MSLMTVNENHQAAQATNEAMQSLTREHGAIERSRSRFYTWLQAQFDKHYHTLRDGGYRRFLEQDHPAELERYDAACEALRREEFSRFAELQTLGLYLHMQITEKEAQFRRRRNRFLMAMSITGMVTSALLWIYTHEAQFSQLRQLALTTGHALMRLFIAQS